MLRLERALVLAQLDRWPESARDFNRAIELLPDYNYPVAALDPGFERLVREAPDDPAAALARIQVLARLGRFAEAIELARAWQERSRSSEFAALERTLGPWIER